MLAPHKKKFLQDVLGEERADALENATGRFAKELEEAGINFKDAPTSFAEADAGHVFDLFSQIVVNILSASDLDPDRRVAYLEDAVHALGQRLNAAMGRTTAGRLASSTLTKEAGGYMRRALDGALEQLTLLGQRETRGPHEAIIAAGLLVCNALKDRVSVVLDTRGRVKSLDGAGLARAYVGDLLGPTRQSHAAARVWAALGLSGAEVAAHLRRDGSKGVGATRVRLYQVINDGDDERVLRAIASAALARGRSASEIKAVVKSIAPELLGLKSAGSSADHARPFLSDLLNGRAARG